MKKIYLHSGSMVHGFYEYEIAQYESGSFKNNHFTYRYYDYVKDDNGRCYKLVETSNLRIEDQFVKQRIKSSEFEHLRDKVIEILSERQVSL